MQPKPPKTFHNFIERYPKLGEAWDMIRDAEGEAGLLDKKTIRLLKLAISIGALKEGSTHSATRKALAAGVSVEEIEQVIALAASTIGFPSTVAAYSWIRETLKEFK